MDSELDIIIRAISDVKSADNATKELVNRVFTKLKDGAIELPINSKLDKSELKKLDDNVRKARKAVVSKYNHLQKEMADPKGFDAFSDKAINELVELGKAYANFNAKAGKKSKNSTAAVSEVKAALGDVFQLYENEIKVLNSKIKELNLQSKVSKSLNSTRAGRSYSHQAAEERYLNKQQQYSERAKGAKERNELFKELKEVRENKSPLPQRVIRGVATKQTLQETEYSGSYPSGFARQMARSRAEARKHELESLRVEKNKQKAEKHANDLENGQVKYNAKERVETRHPNGKIDIDYKDTEVYNKKPKVYSDKENNELKRDVATNELAKILGGIEHRRKDVSVQLFKDYMTGAAAFNKASGNNEWKVIQETLEKTLNRYRGDKGTLGITDGSEKGVFGGHAEAIAAIKEMLAYLGELAKQSETESDISAEQARQLKEMAKIDEKAANEYADELMGKPHYKKSNSTVEGNSQIAKEIKNEVSAVKQATDETFAAVRGGTKATETQTMVNKVDNVRESISDSNEEKVVSTTRDINRDIARATKIDSTTGFNTDAKANELIDVVKNILKELTIINKNTKKAEEKVNKSTKTEKSTKTTNKNKKKVEKRTGLDKFAVDEEFAKDTVWDKKEQDKKQNAIELPADIKSTYKALTDATRLALNKPDGRRRKISKGLIDETPWRKSLPNTQKSVTKALDVLRDSEGKPLANRKTTKESTAASIKDFKTYNNELENKRFKAKLDEQDTKLRDLAAKKNAEKAAKKSGSGEKPPFIPKVIVPEEPLYSNKVQKSSISASAKNQTIWDKFSDAILKATGATDKYRNALDATAEDQDQMAAERIATYGLNNGRNPNDTGDIANIKRALELFRTNKRSIEDNQELAQKIQLTEGVEVDTTKITDALSKALSGRQMRNAQMGGSIPRQIVGAMTGFVGMPSLEKSRAQADGLNQVLGNINKAMQSVLSSIQMKETELSGMEQTGEVKFNKDGYIEEGSSAAYKTLADLEEYKLVLKTILADMQMVDQVVETTGGKFSKMSKLLSFSSPVLRENNDILRNITAGLDKNGKALKYQTRMAEILNYTFQLISRSIGQMLKNWIAQLNPINQIKKAFSDFAGYSPKWQRTMNVVKYNLRDIILPIMEKIAQLLVNMIGFVDIILQKVQAAFGQTPISLFDQNNAKKYKDEMEEIQNITAGFDELHDIGTDSDKDPNNLLGEIYKPELSQEWIDLANRIGDLFAGLIKGDLGFGDVMKEILGIVWDGLKIIGGYIWDFLKETVWPYIKDNWVEILAWVAGAFLAWSFLKWAGNALWSAIFGKFTMSNITGVFGKVGGWISGILGKTAFGAGIIQGVSELFAGGGLGVTLKNAFTHSALITQMGGWGEMLGMIFAQALIAVVGVALGGSILADAVGDATKVGSYNTGLMEAGGKEEDKKSNVGNVIQGAAGGAIAGAAIGSVIPVIGTGLGAVIGGIVGALTTALAPAFEEVAVSARNANNEMQKMEYYQGLVQGYSTEVQKLDELQRILNETLRLQTEKVYEEGEQLGITRTRMDELVGAVQNGTFHTGMLSGAEVGLTDSLIALNEQQIKNTEATTKLEEAKRKLQKAEIDLAIAEDVAAGNFELAAARIEYAEAAMLYTEQEATDKRIQLYKEAGEEEAKYLLQDLTPQQRQKMADINGLTEEELASLVEKWRTSSDEVKDAFLSGVDEDTQNIFEGQMNEIDRIIEEHKGFWQGVGDTLKEIFTFGIADTWTYNGEKKASAEYRSRTIPSMAVGTNYVPNDGLAYLHQGEAVVPKKYNHPYQQQGLSHEEREYMSQMIKTMESLDNTMKQGINVNGQFVQRGSDLVATVEKASNRMSNNILNNKVYAR